MKRSILAAALILAARPAFSHCPTRTTLLGPGQATFDLVYNGYTKTPGDNGTNYHIVFQLPPTASSGTLATGTTYYIPQWDTGGYGWAFANVGGVTCPTVYFGFYPPPTYSEDCSEDTMGGDARPSCLPRFVYDGTSCQSFCDDGQQMLPPFMQPPPPPPPGSPSSPVVLGPAKAFPNPLRPSSGQTVMTFANFPAKGPIKLYDFSGRLVTELETDETGSARWNGTDAAGAAVGTGVYMAVGQDGAAKLKLAVVR